MRFHRFAIKIFMWPLLSLLFIIIGDVQTGSDNSQEFQKNLPEKVLWAALGRDAELPCDVTPPMPNDTVRMVFWFKDTIGMPLYSLDARGGRLNEASHLAVSEDLGSRFYFIADGPPSRARLRIHNINKNDEGIYRCRIDFNNSPTRNFQVKLALVEQPSAPKIFDAEGKELPANASAGPFLEDDELFLSCQVTGGRPHPVVSWWYNNTLLDGVVDSKRGSFTTVNQLLISRVPRHMKKAHLECRASSSDSAGDLVRRIPLIVYLKPDKVKIVSANNLMSHHKPQSIRCEASGSYPPAKLSWLLDGKPIRNAIITEEETEYFTGSIISLKVDAADDGKHLACRATNPHFPGGSTDDKRQIHVAYPPKVAVKMDPGVGAPAKEGADVTLHCDCLARPRPHSYSWYHDGHLVAYNETGGVLPADDSLVLKAVRRQQKGQYACSATNTEGETFSAPFELIIQYAPHCKKGFEATKAAYVAKDTLIVKCFVEAEPKVERFSWTYNTSKGVMPIEASRVQNADGASTVYFFSEENVESLSCWASNEVGHQKVPCVFFISPAALPEPPRNCALRNATYGGLEVGCEPGGDGGLRQSFVLEVNDVSAPPLQAAATTLSDQAERAAPVYRVLGERPLFRLHSLLPGKEYQVLVYAENARGRSEPPVRLPNVRIAAPLPVDALPETGAGATDVAEYGFPKSRLTMGLLALAAIVVILIVGIVSAAYVITCRRSPPAAEAQNRSNKPPDDYELSEAGFGENFHRRSAEYRASMYCAQIDLDAEMPTRLTEGPDLILSPVSFSRNAEY